MYVCTDVSVFCFSGYTHFLYAACPGGEGAVLKIVGLKGLAGSNPVRSALYALGAMAARQILILERKVRFLQGVST